MRYPVELVHRCGAKAGILMYVRDHLPHIPQADMIVKTPEESVDDALKRADREGILWPRIFRSSAVAELYGYEGSFITKAVDGFEEGRAAIKNPNYSSPYETREYFDFYLRRTIENIQKSAAYLRKRSPDGNSDLPDDISVIIAEKSPSSIVGTFIKHPNQSGLYIISATVERSRFPIGPFNILDPEHSAYIYSGNVVKRFEGFSHESVEASTDVSDGAKKRLPDEIKTVVQWHDQIANLPEMDNSWTYQIEFGLDPPCLYQVRPFKPVEFADFELPEEMDYTYFVIGVTPRNGLNARVENRLWERHCNERINHDNQPSVLFDQMRNARHVEYLPNHQASVFTDGQGILAHDDIAAIRQAKVTCVFSYNPFLSEKIKQGDWVNIVSDGKICHIRKISGSSP